jgi:hypothetical protein
MRHYPTIETPKRKEKIGTLWRRNLYVVHLACRFVVFVVEAGHRGEVVVLLALGAGVVGGVLVGVFLDVLCVFWSAQGLCCL